MSVQLAWATDPGLHREENEDSILVWRNRAGVDALIVVCDGINLRNALANCDVVIPMMTILDEALMEAGSFRLVQQWGSGLEGDPRPLRSLRTGAG